MPAKIRSYFPTALKLLLILIVAAGFVAYGYISTIPERADAQQTIVIGPERLAPGSEAGLRVVVQEAGGGQPVSNAQVKVSLQPQAGGQALPLFAGATDASGSVPLNFQVPVEASGDYRLIVETESPNGADRLERPVKVARQFRLLLTSDKPLYQPGQTIHMRALALDPFDLTPARQASIDFVVQDAKGNKVFRQSAPTSAFGVAAADFVLADLVNQGDYKLSASLGDTASEKTVEVKPYVLPKFGVTVTPGRSFYTPGQRVEGSVQADYFFGKPVAAGQVRLVGLVYDVERVELVNLTGQTDANGRYDFGFDLPGYFAGAGLDSSQAQFALEVTVIDQTDHAEQTSALLPVAAQPIVIEAVAESGSLRPGVENIVYILTAYPDGAPAQTDLEIYLNQNPPQKLTTNEFGLAELRLQPDQGDTTLAIQAGDERGFSAARTVQFQAEEGRDHVLLRAERAAYAVGETMNLVALTAVDSGSIYLDIVKEGQTLSTRSTPVQAGRADFAIDLSPDLYGTLELHAYKVLLDGTLVRDTRLVVVDQPRDLAVAVAADKEAYRPGESAVLDFQTTAQVDGTPVQAALGLAVVDESVFALQRQDPGFAKLYFLLEAELLEPFYQVKGFSLPVAYPPDQAPAPDLRQAQDTSIRAAWAAAPTSGLALQANSRPEKMEALRQVQTAGFLTLTHLTLLGLALLPVLLWLVVILALRGSGLVKRSLWGLAKVSGLLLVIWAALYGVVAFITSLSYEVQRFFWQLNLEEVLPFVLGGVFVLALLGLAIYAWRRRDEAAKFIFLLSAGGIALLVLIFNLADQAPPPGDAWGVALIIALLLLPGAYLLYGQKLWAEGRRGPAWLPTLLGGLLSPVLLALPLFLLMSSGGLAMAPQPEVMMLEAAAPAPTAARQAAGLANEAEAPAAEAKSAAAGPTEAPRLRQFFPETLYWNPEVVTNEAGQSRLEIPLADSITTWRLTALASSQDGRLGFTTQGVRVFQDFFVDVDLPAALTQGDEISIPVGVFNYLPQAQPVRLVVEPDPWFELLGQAEQTLTIAANDIEVVYFPIRVKAFGRQGFQVTAWGEKMNDAVRREVRVLPNGQEVRLTDSNWLRENKELTLDLPPELVPRTAQVEVKIYTGVLAQVVEGLEKILRLPHG
ncbi:MAG: alpha-2-macroglobulin family protein [Chloroflexota bacterium]